MKAQLPWQAFHDEWSFLPHRVDSQETLLVSWPEESRGPAPLFLSHAEVLLLGRMSPREEGFPGGTIGKEPACQCRRHKRCGFNPWDWEDVLEERMATHSGIPAWRIPRIEEPGGLQSMRLQRVRQDWSDFAQMHVPIERICLRCNISCSPLSKGQFIISLPRAPLDAELLFVLRSTGHTCSPLASVSQHPVMHNPLKWALSGLHFSLQFVFPWRHQYHCSPREAGGPTSQSSCSQCSPRLGVMHVFRSHTSFPQQEAASPKGALTSTLSHKHAQHFMSKTQTLSSGDLHWILRGLAKEFSFSECFCS